MIEIYQLNYCIGEGQFHHEHYNFASIDTDEECDTLLGYDLHSDFDYIGGF